MAEDFYTILGIAYGASQEDILEAYRESARKCHPDINPDDPKAASRFKQVQAAFEVLGNPAKRTEYDRAHIVFRQKPNLEEVHKVALVRMYPIPRRPREPSDLRAFERIDNVATALLVYGLASLFISFGAMAAAMNDARGDYVALAMCAGLMVNSTVVILGAINMLALRVWLLSVVAAVLTCFLTPCCWCGGFPIGLWALIVLMDNEVKGAFSK